MVQKLDSDALEPVSRSLGIAGAGASSETVLADAEVIQVVDLNRQARRGRVPHGSGGIFRMSLRNIHAGAGVLVSNMVPYLAGTGTIAPFPSPVPRGFDLWLLGASAIQSADSGFAFAILSLSNTLRGWGQDDNGAAIVSGLIEPLVFWDGAVGIAGMSDALNNINSGQMYHRINRRIPREREGAAAADLTTIFFETSASAASTIECNMAFGMFPITLGQDAAF